MDTCPNCKFKAVWVRQFVASVFSFVILDGDLNKLGGLGLRWDAQSRLHLYLRKPIPQELWHEQQ